jgi:hypothetical protein
MTPDIKIVSECESLVGGMLFLRKKENVSLVVLYLSCWAVPGNQTRVN